MEKQKVIQPKKNVLEYIENAIKYVPHNIAYEDETSQLTFEEVYKNARSIGTYLIKRGIERKPIVVYMKKSPKAINAFLGVLYGNDYYVPLDEEMPSFRVELILQKLEPELIICDEETRELVDDIYKEKAVLFDDIISTKIDEVKLLDVRSRQIDTDPMYIVFTSGSTGIPKGVIANHRSVIDYLENLSEVLSLDGDTIFGLQSPLYFDACLKEIYPTLKFGAKMVIIPKSLFMFPIKLVEFMNEYKINTVCWVVSALTMISSFKVLDTLQPKYLRTVAFGSEVFQIKQFNRWKKALPNTTFINLYGPTEATGMSCFYHADRLFEEEEVIPVGKPFDNTRILLIHEEHEIEDYRSKDNVVYQEIKKPGQVGEIYIVGTPVTIGYFDDSNRTKEAFIQNPLQSLYKEICYRTGDLAKYDEKGNLVFVSRKDHQIKHMGHRIELGEIEAIVSKEENVGMNCCIYNKEKQKIILYYVGNVDKKELTASLKETLPRYMVPNKMKQLESMPLTANGKIDRKALSLL